MPTNDHPVRGVNPEPIEGWPWCLTDYEIAYIKEFRVRPVREGTWAGRPEQEALLNAEAEGVVSGPPVAQPRTRRDIPRSVFFPVVGVVLLVCIASIVATLLARDQLSLLESRSAEIADELKSSNSWIDSLSAEIREDYRLD